jgi:low temperature requirement protein LtrA
VTITVFVVGVLLWLVSLLVPEPWRFAFWGAALLIEGATPWVARRAMASVPYHAGHLPERYGLFTLILLGEALVAVVVGTHTASWHVQSILAAVFGFLTAAGLWWLYFGSIERAAVQRSLLARNTFIYGHLFIALGLAMVGVGIKQTIVVGGMPASGVWTLPAGVACFLAALVAVRVATVRSILEPALIARLAVAAAAAGLAIAAGTLGSLVVAGPVALALWALVGFDMALRLGAPEG